ARGVHRFSLHDALPICGVGGAVPRLGRVALRDGERALRRWRRARREVTTTPGLATAALALSALATPALARVRTASGDTHLALWQDRKSTRLNSSHDQTS